MLGELCTCEALVGVQLTKANANPDMVRIDQNVQKCTSVGGRSSLVHPPTGLHRAAQRQMQRLALDPELRGWVFLPLTLCIVLMKLIQQYMHMVSRTLLLVPQRAHGAAAFGWLHGQCHDALMVVHAAVRSSPSTRRRPTTKRPRRSGRCSLWPGRSGCASSGASSPRAPSTCARATLLRRCAGS